MSPDSQNLLARILLALAEGERKVEDARKEISIEECYDIQAIFKVLDNNGDNYITPKDIQKYLNSHGLEVNFKEVKLLILFYDQDHDFSLTYGQIFKMIHPGKEFPKIPKYKNDEELNVKVDRKLYNLLEKEILMARSVLALFDEIKHKRDFNIHSAFHALKYYACITGDSINIFLKNSGMRPTAGDIRAIVKRLDINKDNIIDFCEFHAFLGYPDCTFCCPCFPCPNCAVQYCDDCLQDIPCYLLGCDHKGMDSKMKCTSVEHNPGTGGVSSLINSMMSYSPTSKKMPKYDGVLDSYGLNQRRYGKKSGLNKSFNNRIENPDFIDRKNAGFYDSRRNGYNNRGNMSPEQFKLLQGLTNPEQLNKFMTISGIIDRQNSQEYNLTDNLSLRLSPIRDFDPKEWGCRNCPCNIHSNPNVSCDCCSCDICPFKSNKIEKNEKVRQIKFPKASLFSYSYSYDIDNGSPNKSFISEYNQSNNSLYMNSPKKSNVYYDKETNKYKKTMANSSDDEQEYNDYMSKVINLRDTFDNLKKKKSNINPPNSMIYSDETGNMNFDNRNNINQKEKSQYNDNKEDNNIDVENNIEENINEEEEEEIRRSMQTFQKTFKNDKNKNMSSITKKGILKNKNYHKEENDDINNNEDENGNEENDNIPDQDKIGQQNNNEVNPEDQNANNNDVNNKFNNTYQNPKQNFDNIDPKSRAYISSSSPIIDDRNPNNDNNNYNTNPEIHRPNIDPFSSTTQTIYINNNRMNRQKPNMNSNNKFVSGIDEEESEEDVSNNNIYKSQEEIIDENEKIFIEYIKALIKSELEIEYAKRDLMRQEDFNAEDAFRLFEKEGTNVVTKNDLIYGLKLLGIKPTNNQIKIIFNKYDLDGNDYIDYDDFFDMVISFKDSDRKKEEKRKPNRNVSNRNINLFSQRTRELYKKLFLVIIEEEERLELLKQNLNIDDYLMNNIFNKINVDKDGICNKNEFANYCLRKKICKEKKDAYLAFIRLNRNRDGGLQTKEFSVELKSSLLNRK